MNENDIIKFEEKNSDLQLKFLEEKGFNENNMNDKEAINLLESSEYWDFVEEEFERRCNQ